MKRLRPFALIALTLLAACAGPRAKKGSSGKDGESQDDQTDANALPDVNVEEASLRGKDFQTVEGLSSINFDYDSASLKDAQLEILRANAAYPKAHPTLEVLVAGFCDERGTTEYNLALGQKRAKEVREYYVRLGVPARALATISYGKESQSCSEATEECWAANRRADTRIRLRLSQNKAKAPEKPAP